MENVEESVQYMKNNLPRLGNMWVSSGMLSTLGTT